MLFIKNTLAVENEMNRVLKQNGLIIKVTPKTDYLSELRKSLEIKTYENEEIIDQNIRSKYEVLMKEELVNTYKVNNEIIKYLVNMTPLMNNINDVPNIKFITIALNIYVLRSKNDKMKPRKVLQ